MIEVSDFERVDIRGGPHPQRRGAAEARKASYSLELDLGPLGRRCSVAELAGDYQLKELVGRQVRCVQSFPPRRVAGVRVPGRLGI